MTAPSYELINGVSAMIWPSNGPMIATPEAALDLIGRAYGKGVDVVVVPTTAFPADFYTLSTGLAGEITQKFLTYVTKLAIVGDISEHTSRSSALSAYVYESNRGDQLWFVDSRAELAERLARTSRSVGRGGGAAPYPAPPPPIPAPGTR